MKTIDADEEYLVEQLDERMINYLDGDALLEDDEIAGWEEAFLRGNYYA